MKLFGGGLGGAGVGEDRAGETAIAAKAINKRMVFLRGCEA